MRSFTRVGLGVVTSSTMAISTFAIIAAGVLASHLIDEFDITRAQVGLLVTANGVVGAFASPVFGRVTDRLGAVKSVVGCLLLGSFTLIAWSVSPTYALLFTAALLTGLSNAWGNPSTNALIVDNVPAGQRGVVTGIKQSGVQIGTFLGGLLLPVFAGWWSWRVALVTFLFIPLTGLIGMIGRKDHGPVHVGNRSELGKLPVSVRWITLYGFLSGAATSSMIAFLPLFANESVGWSEAAGGSLVALTGLAGIGARVMWPRMSEKGLGHGRTLRILSSVTTVAALVLAAVSLERLGAWALPVAALLIGGGAVAWNAVGMLAVMDFAPIGGVGKGTGMVYFGFLSGLAIGPPLMGLSVDQLGTYTIGWLATAVLLVGSAITSLRIPSGTTVATP